MSKVIKSRNMTPENKSPVASKDLLNDSLRLTGMMAEEENIAVLLRRGLELCTRVLDCERGFLISEDAEGRRDVLEKAGEAGQGSFSTTALRLVKEKQESLLISDTINDDVLGVQESISRNDIHSVLCTLLTGSSFGGKRVYLYLDSRVDRHSLSLGDLERFRVLSKLMGTLIRKSEMIAEKDATIEELKGKIEEKRFADMVYGSDSFKRCLTLITQGAPAEIPVLLLGETGTGKERLARLVHDMSHRKDRPFLAVNCGAIPANLMESQLFGHEKGAFTGAVSSRKGFFEEVNGGTLFLDEIGELPIEVQTRFLRALQEGEIMRVGSSKTVHVDVRIVAATNMDLEKAVAENRFRKDLFYRLNVLPITVPPVRDRGEDALLLARFFLKQYCESFGSKHLCFSRDAEKAILRYDWPGNVREIQNRVQRVVITVTGPVIESADLGLQNETPVYKSLHEAREAVDRQMIAYAMSRSPDNLTNASKILDIDRKSLRILLEKYGIQYNDR